MADKSSKNWFAKHKVLSVILGFIGLMIIAGAAGGGSNTNNSQQNSTATNDSAQTAQPEAAQPKKEEPSVPAEYKSALAQATTYANDMHLSKKGVQEQLVSEYGGKFKPEAAKYAIDNVKADWNANALAQAKTYQNDMHLSPAAVRDQLVSEYGGKFTAAEADYAIKHLNE